MSTPVSLRCNNSNLSSFEVNLTYTQLPSIGKVSTLAAWTNQHAMRFQLLNVTPAKTCMSMVDATAPLVHLNNSDLICNTTAKVSYYSTDSYLPKGWFLLCGLQACNYVPKNATGGLCILGRLTVSLLTRNTSAKYNTRSRRSLP